MDNPELTFAAKMQAEGWDVTKRGWPDFICRRNGELMYVEVKGPRDGLSPQQYETISDLRRAGIPTYVWGPDTGFVEVGPPVGESVFSLQRTIAELRRHIERLENPQPIEPEAPIHWTFNPHDRQTINWLAKECRRTHTKHPDSTLGTTGTWCSDVWVLSWSLTPEEIMERTGAPSIGRQRQILDKLRESAFTFQHGRMHNATHTLRCDSCDQLDKAA